MFLRYVKEISSETASRLKAAKKTLTLLEQIEDVSLFNKDLEAFLTKRDKNGFLKQITATSIKLKTLFEPEYEITERFNKTIYTRTSGSKAKKQLFFNCGANLYGNIAVTIANSEGNSIAFYLGEFLPNFQGNVFYQEVKDFHLILPMAKFFYNRQATYREIFEILGENKKRFERSAGKAFVKDLTTLFSAEEVLPESDLAIPAANLEVQSLGRRVKRKENIFLGTAIYHPKETAAGAYYATEIKTEAWLNEKQQLIITATPRAQTQPEASKVIKKVREDPEFSEFVNLGINAWARALVTEANFGASIYAKIKTSLLIENL